ncbi:hypothetical protein BKA80DRAFT_312722 [Phyllosticta citrichinensis]
MDLNALNHEYHKIMVDANVATVRNRDTGIGSPPPAYTPQDQTPPQPIYDGTLDDDDDDDDDDDEDDDEDDDDGEDDLYADPNLAHSISGALSRSSTPESTQDDTKDGEKTIHMNNRLSVLGSQNIITASPLDGMRWTASILAILNSNWPLPCQEHHQQRAAPAVAENQATDAQSIFSPQARGPVNILIDCSIHVVGDRNIVGGNPAAAAYGALAAARGGNVGTAAQTQTQPQTQTTNGTPDAAPASAPTAVVDGIENDKPAPPAAPLTPPAAADSVAPALPRPSLAGAAPARNSNNSSSNNNQQPTHANGARKRQCVGSGVPAACTSTSTVDERAARASFVDANAVAAQLADAGVCGGFGREDDGMSRTTRKRAREEDEGDGYDADA